MIPEPNVTQEKADRQFQRDKIAALFRLHPLEDIEPEVLKAITPHYQQRISECRRQLGMTIQNRPRSRQDATGRKVKQDGAYRWLPAGDPLGADSSVPDRAREWPTVHGRPFEEPFRLTAEVAKA